jgi:hypothetical protein
MPRAAPVIMATLFSRFFMMVYWLSAIGYRLLAIG